MVRKYKITNMPIGSNNDILIKKEIHKYHPYIIRSFVELFPAIDLNYCVAYYKYIESESSKNISELHGYAIWYRDSKDFWYRWNRFKKLIPFL